MLAPDHATAAIEISEVAGELAEAAARRLGLGGEAGPNREVSTDEMSDAVAPYCFPDELWAGIVYDLVVAAHTRVLPLETLVAALVPLYFGRVGSLIVEARHLDQGDAEERVERQARAFELRKPYLVERWNAAEQARVAADAAASASVRAGEAAG
jgi:hypothetical protein